MEDGALVVLVMGACVAGCICAICAIEQLIAVCATTETRDPLLDV
jgi:hypothetical protein